MSRQKFDAWFDAEYSAARNHELPALIEELREVKFAVWKAAYAAALEEAAKECDLMQAMWERQAREGDNTGASDFRADAAEQCAMGIRALKD